MEQRDPHGTADSERETNGAKRKRKNCRLDKPAEIARIDEHDPLDVTPIAGRCAQDAERVILRTFLIGSKTDGMLGLRSATGKTQTTEGFGL